MKTNKKLLKILVICISFSSAHAQMPYVNEVWSLTNGNPTNGHNEIACALDPNGNLVYIGNHTNGNNSDIFLTCVHPNGNVVWQQICPSSTTEDDWGTDLVIDASGNIYVTGVHHNGFNRDYFTAKYSQSGTLLWQQLYNGSHNGDDLPTAIDIDANGDVYVTGTSEGGVTMSDLVTLKYDSNGNQQWVRVYDFNNKVEIASDLTVDNNGDLLVLGTSANSFSNSDFVTRKYDSNGNVLATERHQTAGNGYDYPHELTIDNNNNIYIIGTSESAGNKNIKTLALDNSLNVLWVNYIDGMGDTDEGFGIVENAGSIYITGYVTNNMAGKDFVTIQYEGLTGAQGWRNDKICLDPSQTAKGNDITIGMNNLIVVTGEVSENGISHLITRLIKPNGKIFTEFTHLGDNQSSGISQRILTSNDDIFSIGRTNSGGNQAITTVKNKIVNKEIVSVTDNSTGQEHSKNELLIRFDKDAVIHSAIDDTKFTSGILSDFVKPSVIGLMSEHTGFECAKLRTFKIFRKMTTADSCSITRLDDTIKIDPFWATLSVYFNDGDDLDLIESQLDPMYPDIWYSQKNWLVQPHNVPNDFYITTESESLIQTSPYTNAHINVDPAWDIEVGQAHTKVGVYDTPIFWGHEDFGDGTFAGSKIVGGWDFYDNVAASTVTNPANSHGTACAGIIGGLRNNGIGVAGIAGGDVDGQGNTGVQLFSLGIFGEDDFGNNDDFVGVATAAEAIVEGAVWIQFMGSSYGYGLHIQNHSWGGPVNDLLESAVLTAWRNHCVVVASRGNDGVDDLVHPACVSDESVLNIGASGFDGEYKDEDQDNGDNWFDIEWSSNFGGEVDVIAPGVTDIVVAPINPNEPFGLGDSCSVVATNYECFNGSSAGAPHVAGVSALLYSNHNVVNGAPNNLATEDIEYFIENGALDKGVAGYDEFNGWGLLNAYQTIAPIEFPKYYVYHSQEVPFTSTAVLDQNVILANNVNGIAAGNYIADRYQLNWTYVEVLPTSDIILDWWTLEASTYRGTSAANPITGEPWMQIVPYITIGSNAAVVSAMTFSWFIKTSLNGQTINKWLSGSPFDMKYTFSLYVENTNLTSMDEELKDVMVLYPNPADNMITVSIDVIESEQTILTIHDLTGREIVRQDLGDLPAGENQIAINLNNLSSGTYMCTVANGANINTQKFVKN
ncbi:MAG: S8 family serine peptidase [Crocinitomicaceae bacterium]